MALSTFMDTPCVFAIEEHMVSYTMPCEVSPANVLQINVGLTESQQEQLIKVLKSQSGAFAWECIDMKGIYPDTCIHHIYMDVSIPPVRKPQRKMNPTLKDIVKDELQKILNAGFIFLISDSKWVSPLVVVPNKFTWKWHICVDF